MAKRHRPEIPKHIVVMTTPASPSTKSDCIFKRIITIFTSLGLAVLYGWLACLVRQPDDGFNFQWRWSGLIWAIIGLGSTAYFWYKIWPKTRPARADRVNDLKGALAFALPNLWWLTLPLRPHSDQYSWGELTGFIAPLAIVICYEQVLVRLVKTFQRVDAEDLKALENSDENSTPGIREK
jgi:hypothetical protein